MNEPINANLYSRATGAVFQGINPISVDFGSLHAHSCSVSHGLHYVNAARVNPCDRTSHPRGEYGPGALPQRWPRSNGYCPPAARAMRRRKR